MRERKEAARFLGHVLEVDKATAFADDVEQVAMFAGCGIGELTGRALAGFRAGKTDEHGAAGRVADIAHYPVATGTVARGQVIAAHRLGLPAETDREVRGIVTRHYAASLSPMRSTG